MHFFYIDTGVITARASSSVLDFTVMNVKILICVMAVSNCHLLYPGEWALNIGFIGFVHLDYTVIAVL